MRDRYGARASHFELGVDHDVYQPKPVARRRDTVIFYARDVTPRRAVPIGVLALEELRRRRPDTRFVLFGDEHQPATPFPYEHLGDRDAGASWRGRTPRPRSGSRCRSRTTR